MKGKKYDSDKLEWDLIPFETLEEVVKVLMYGTKKYSKYNWQIVGNAEVRYFNALLRHLFAFKKGEKTDPETGLSHISHALCCLIFLKWVEDKKLREQK